MEWISHFISQQRPADFLQREKNNNFRLVDCDFGSIVFAAEHFADGGFKNAGFVKQHMALSQVDVDAVTADWVTGAERIRSSATLDSSGHVADEASS